MCFTGSCCCRTPSFTRIRDGDAYDAEAALVCLKRGHIASCILQALDAIVLAIVTPLFAAFYTDLFTYYNPFPRVQHQNPTNAGSFPAAIHWLPATFTLLAALHHGIAAGTWTTYKQAVVAGRGWLAWAEYSLSATIMNVAIACICGTSQFTDIVLIATATSTTMFFGFLSEAFASLSELWYAWCTAIVGFVPFLGAWAAMAVVYSQSAAGAPWFVHAIFGTMFVLETLFAVNLAVFLQSRSKGRPLNVRAAIRNEWGKIILSLTAKTLLAWLVFGGLRK